MGIELFWDDHEQTVMLCEFNGRWTWAELQTMLATVKQLSAERQQVFGAIIDVSQGLTLPGGSIFNREALTNFQQISQMGSGGKGPVAIVGMNSMIRTIFDTVKQVDRKSTSDVFFASNLDEARQQIYPLVKKTHRSA